MHVVLGEPTRLDPYLLGVAADPRERRLRRLLHHLAELARDLQPALARVGGRLDEEHVAADLCDREPGRDAGVSRSLAWVAGEAARAECLSDGGLADVHVLDLAAGDPGRRLAHHVPD